jgi:hypothetical protein
MMISFFIANFESCIEPGSSSKQTISSKETTFGLSVHMAVATERLYSVRELQTVVVNKLSNLHSNYIICVLTKSSHIHQF